MKKLIIIILILTLPVTVFAKHKNPEKWYQGKYCKGKTEVVMPDKTRCDCLTETHAIEFDFGNKLYESLGQSLNYGLQTGKKPGIYLILESEKDYKYWIRLNSIIDHYKLNIDTWKIENYGEKKP